MHPSVDRGSISYVEELFLGAAFCTFGAGEVETQNIMTPPQPSTVDDDLIPAIPSDGIQSQSTAGYNHQQRSPASYYQQMKQRRLEKSRKETTLEGVTHRDRLCCLKAVISEAARLHSATKPRPHAPYETSDEEDIGRFPQRQYDLSNAELAAVIANDAHILTQSTPIADRLRERPFSGVADNYAVVQRELSKLALWAPWQ